VRGHGLRDALGELVLAEAGLGAKVVDELTEREVVFDLALTVGLLASARGALRGTQLWHGE
jgi:hypothetical protein